jgi:ABC-type nitrate/sulfonate/bicarbonate transport system substrate-binding protein
MSRTATGVVVAALTFAVVLHQPAQAQTKVRVGQPQAGTFQFVPLQVGIEAGIYRKHGIELEVISFGGGARMQQAMAAESIDIAIGSGPELAFVAKGAPVIGVAAVADAPYPIVLAVLKDSPIKRAEDLKGKTISISSKASLTDWLGQELSRQLGWGSTGINLAPLGTTAAQMAALKTRQIDGMIVEVNAGFRMEEDGGGRIVVQFGDRIKVFHIYVVYARKAFLEKNPDAVRAFLAGWFDSVGLMRAQRTRTIDIVRRTAEVSQGIATRDYDELMGMFNPTGKFNPKALEVLGRSFVDMGSLPQVPDMQALISERYLPVPRDQGND